jgi:hypothetical protein
LEERYDKLAKTVPEYLEWDIEIAKHELLFQIQHRFCVNLGVCEYLFVGEHRQRCRLTKDECPCAVPQHICVIRDQALMAAKNIPALG